MFYRGPRTHRMPSWIRVVFLNYLPPVLFMQRPRKTRLHWMNEMPGIPLRAWWKRTGMHCELILYVKQDCIEIYIYNYQLYQFFTANQAGLHQSQYASQYSSKSNVDTLELSDLHHPNCKINRSNLYGKDVSNQ